MEHIKSLDNSGILRLRQDIFPKIDQGETILFLGAGLSVGERIYLSKHIIDYYCNKKNIEPPSDDITEFIDILLSNPEFDRNEFDDFVSELLEKYEVTETHKIIASIPWKEIITTNMDLVIEKAFDLIKNTPRKKLQIYPIRNWDRYAYRNANDEVKYVKLNGCMFDKRKYPFAFSTKDFEDRGRFYRTVLKGLSDISPRIQFLTVGYSFKDAFAKKLLERFDRYNYRGKRWIIRIDPNVQDTQLNFFTDNKICIVRMTSNEFFNEYNKWKEEIGTRIVTKNNIQYKTKKDEVVRIPSEIAIRLGQNLIQLSNNFNYPFVSAKQFYQGKEPSYEIIKKDYDVIKKGLLKDTIITVKRYLDERNTIVPIILLKGNCGIGKSTLLYRIIRGLVEDEKADIVGFEIKSPGAVKAVDLRTILGEIKSKNIVLMYDNIEVDSLFKSLLDLRHQISIEQLNDFNIVFLASIRSNILQKYKLARKHYKLIEIDTEEKFSKDEIIELIEKLNIAGVLKYKDAKEKNYLAQKMTKYYQGDTFLSLLNLVNDSNHSNILMDAYNQLSEKTKQAYIYTSLLHRFMIAVPASLLQKLLSKDWEAFKRDILEYDCQGILINEVVDNRGSSPDLYFRTKHPMIADLLVKMILPSEDARYEKYEKLLIELNLSNYNATLVVDLLKSLSYSNDLSRSKINKLFDICSSEFIDNQHFVLHYGINLQTRKSPEYLLKGIEIIKYAESTSENRNLKLIHRRAVLNFYMAKIKFKEETELLETNRFLQEARELFVVKLSIDPFSIYSYKHYLEMEIWMLENYILDKQERYRQITKIENLFRQGENNVYEDLESMARLRAKFENVLRDSVEISKEGNYLQYLSSIEQDEQLKPYALILLYYYYQDEDSEKNLDDIIIQLEEYEYLDEVLKVLFKHYGERLYLSENRKRFFTIISKQSRLETDFPILFHYYAYIAEAYNKNFNNAMEHIVDLKRKHINLNPTLNQTWIDFESKKPQIFEGIVSKSNEGLKVKIIELQHKFRIKKSIINVNQVETGLKYKVKLYFYLTGIRAELLD